METVNQILNQVSEAFGSYVPDLLTGIAVLALGFIIAYALSAIINRLVYNVGMFSTRRVSGINGTKAADSKAKSTAGIISKVVFYTTLFITVLSFCQTMGFKQITEPMDKILIPAMNYMPNIFTAGLLLIIAWMLASIVRFILVKLMVVTDMENKLSIVAGASVKNKAAFGNSISEVSYWLILLLFVPAILNALDLSGMLDPVNSIIGNAAVYLPGIATASAIFLAGWMIAKFVQNIVINLFQAAGTDQVSEKVGLESMLDKNKLSNLIGLAVYTAILIPVLIASMSALNLKYITEPATSMLNNIIALLPSILAASLVLLVAYIVAKIIGNIVTNLLVHMGFRKLVINMGIAKEPFKKGWSPSEIVGYVVTITIVLYAAMEGAKILSLTTMATLMGQLLSFATQAIIGVMIFALGMFIANVVGKIVVNTHATHGSTISLIARATILAIAGAIALKHMGLAENTINIAFGVVLGAICVAAAIAFGIGGRNLAAKKLENWEKGLKSAK